MQNRKILLIEDNQDDIALTLRAFNRIDLKNEIIVLNDGEKASNYIDCAGEYLNRDCEKKHSLILLDLKLPKVDGKDILKKIRSNPQMKYIPVVILTSSMEEKDIEEGYLFGANSYIRKPIDYNKFQEVLQSLIQYWLKLNEIPA